MCNPHDFVQEPRALKSHDSCKDCFWDGVLYQHITHEINDMLGDHNFKITWIVVSSESRASAFVDRNTRGSVAAHGFNAKSSRCGKKPLVSSRNILRPCFIVNGPCQSLFALNLCDHVPVVPSAIDPDTVV